MNRFKRILLPIIVLVVGIVIGVALYVTGPKVEHRQPPQQLPVVESFIVQPQDYQVVVNSQGTVTPQTQSTLIPEVAGRIVALAPGFRNGGAFAKGEVLFRINPDDYQHAITIAEADLARAKLTLEQEKALAQHALEDWQKLGRKDKPTDLTLHKPQVASARADVAAAEARLQQAQTNLARTRIRAPYAGRVLEKKVDVGQYVSPGTLAATIYAMDIAEIRVPLTDNQLAFVELPDTVVSNKPAANPATKVTLHARVGNQRHQWQGRLVRSEGAIDTTSRQLFVIAQIDDPFRAHQSADAQQTPPLKIGQFVEAEIFGQPLQDVFILPRVAVEAGDKVLVISNDKKIQRRDVQVALRKGGQVIVSGGLKAGERISLTPMPFAREGTAIELIEERKKKRNVKYPPLPTLSH